MHNGYVIASTYVTFSSVIVLLYAAQLHLSDLVIISAGSARLRVKWPFFFSLPPVRTLGNLGSEWERSQRIFVNKAIIFYVYG